MVMDLVFRVEKRPRPGETMPGNEFGMFLGGKGFNQAVGCRRLGAEVTMVGRVGTDYFGDRFIEKLAEEGIDANLVTRDNTTGTGVACPIIDATGENSIIGVPRANMRITAADVDAASAAIQAADILLLQFEIPIEASRRAAEIAHAGGTLVQLDPAPVHHGARGLGVQVDYIVPNEVEAHMLTNMAAPAEWGSNLMTEVRQAVVISLGSAGAAVYDGCGLRSFPAHRVKVVDTTGAGDAFRAGLAVMLAQGRPLDEAVRFANACGALACTVLGAEPSMPRLDAVEKLLKENR